MPSEPPPWDDAPCGLLITATDGAILHVNATFCRWLGYQAQDLVGVRRLSQLLPMGARLFHQTHWAPLLQIQGSLSEVQLDMLHRDGQRVPMMLNAQRKLRDGVQVDEIAVFMATDRKKYERELLNARRIAEETTASLRNAETRLIALNEALSLEHRRKDEFLATLAHELRNPLAPMTSVIETLRQKELNGPYLEWARDMLDRQVRQMTHLVDDLLDTSRISQGKIELRLETVELCALLQAAADAARPAFDKAGQSLGIYLGEQRLRLRGDPVRLTQIVSNLLTNASKYTPAGGSIELALRQQGDDAVISVRDNGIGIPPDELHNIFGMFSQLTPALERAHGGLGIGLALTRGLVQLHGGSVSADSAGADQGSVFTVHLPLPADILEAEPEPVANAIANVGGAKALIVDDNVDAADSLAMALDFVGYVTHTENTAGAALAAIGIFQPRLALLDIGLPDMDGYTLARRIRELPGGDKILLIAATGWGQETDRLAAMEAGFDLHMTKPIDFMKLHQTISDHFAAH
ncbi:MAG: ATP-binding protein [Pseudomonadota bacterium]